jgi:mRNA interferase HigB
VNIIAPRAIRAFAERHPEAEEPLRNWYNHLRRIQFQNYAELKTHFNHVDIAKDDNDFLIFIFDISGNKYRAICSLDFERNVGFIKLILTHEEYTFWNKKGRPI